MLLQQSQKNELQLAGESGNTPILILICNLQKQYMFNSQWSSKIRDGIYMDLRFPDKEKT